MTELTKLTLAEAREGLRTKRFSSTELTQAFLDARRRGVFYENTSHCFQYGRPCPYFALCRSGGSPIVIENQYQRVAPHEELRDAEPADVVPF